MVAVDFGPCIGHHVSSLGDKLDLNYGCQIERWQQQMREINRSLVDATGHARPLEEFLYNQDDGEISDALFEHVTSSISLVNSMGEQFGIAPITDLPTSRFECTPKILETVHSRLQELQIHLQSVPNQKLTDLQTITQTYTILIEALKGLNKAICEQFRTMIQHMSQGT